MHKSKNRTRALLKLQSTQRISKKGTDCNGVTQYCFSQKTKELFLLEVDEAVQKGKPARKNFEIFLIK